VTGSLAVVIATDTKPPEEKLSLGLPFAAGLAAKLPIESERTFTTMSLQALAGLSAGSHSYLLA
jgi:hypothetical protein